MALTYGEISAITEKYFIPKCVDQIFTSNALFQRMKKGKMYDTYPGGTSIMQPIVYALTTAVGWYSGTDTLDTTANDQITSLEFNMKMAFANITVTRQDELKNSGPAQIIDFVKAKVQVAEKTLNKTLGDGLYNAGTTANQITGLRLACAITGTYGGIAKATYSWLQGQVDSTTTALTLPAMETLFGLCSIDNDAPSVIVTTQTQFDNFHGLLQPQERYVDEDTASAGFRNLAFRGVPVIVDNRCTSGYMFMLNEKYIKLLAHKDENFRFEPFQKRIDQNVACAKLYWAGELTCSNPRMQGMFSALA
jgi:hypothetical protein